MATRIEKAPKGWTVYGRSRGSYSLILARTTTKKAALEYVASLKEPKAP